MRAKQGKSGRKRLLESAAAVFASRGYTEVGIAEILKSGEVQAPTLYHHFGDKEGLFVAWAEWAFAELGDEIESVVENFDDSVNRLVAFARSVGEQSRIDIIRTLDSGNRLERSESRDRIERAYFKCIFEPLCVTLLSAADEGRLYIDSIDKTATAFLFGALSVSERYSPPGSGADSDYRWWVLHFLHGFGKPLP